MHSRLIISNVDTFFVVTQTMVLSNSPTTSISIAILKTLVLALSLLSICSQPRPPIAYSIAPLALADRSFTQLVPPKELMHGVFPR
jgi:hypothetical protein